ncbi:MAG TPA: uroporphyrinogen decarboxylase family protein [Spirochaetia bacterium]|nr:uroporphyrinogen decarboxylase family protein [Spirochaetia bacterium]
MKPREIFLGSLLRAPTPRPATGSATSVVTMDLMEKAGIYFPKAHLDAEMMASLAAAGHTEIGFDNVMPLFSVWHESAALGCRVDWGRRDRMPDSRGAIYRIEDPIRIPKDFLNKPECRVPLRAIRLLKKRFGNEVAVLGKVFGPWTLGYHMYGVEEFLINTLLKPDAVKLGMDSLKEVTVLFAMAQIEAGADALCLGDHATRDLCSPEAYREFLLDIHRELNERIGCPLILHICGDTADRIHYIRKTGIDCFHFDSKVPTGEARTLAGDELALMGGTDNIAIIRGGTEQTIIRDVEEKKEYGIDIIGPECAVPLDAPYRNMKTLVREVKKDRPESCSS